MQYKRSDEISICPKGVLFNSFLNLIQSFGAIYYSNYSFRECPEIIKEERKFRVTGDKKNILTKTGTSCYHCGTIWEKELDKSIEEHKWKIKTTKKKSKSIMIDVATSDFDVQIDDEVVIVMNMKKRTLKFIINNKDKGDSYTNIPIDKPIYPVVISYHINDSVEISEI